MPRSATRAAIPAASSWLLPALASCLLVAACGGEAGQAERPADPGAREAPDAGSGGETEPRTPSDTEKRAQILASLQLEPWFDDFPVEVHLSPRADGRWYDRTRRQALQKVIDNLQGNCTYAAWQFAKRFFRQPSDEAVDLLIETMDRAFSRRELGELVENIAEAMGRSDDPRFAPALLRALRHPRQAVHAKAMSSLARCGDAAAVREAQQLLDRVGQRAFLEWFRAARAVLPPDEVGRLFEPYLRDPRFSSMHHFLVGELVELGPEAAMPVVSPFWDTSSGQVKLQIALVLHANGDRRGTQAIREVLSGEAATAKALVLEGLAGSDLDHLEQSVFLASEDPDPVVRTAAARLLSTVEGEDAEGMLGVLANDVVPSVRREAMRGLVRRGVEPPIDRLLEIVRTGSGTRLATAVDDLLAIGDDRAVPVFAERLADVMATAPQDARPFIRALARTRSPKAFPALAELFLGEETVIDDSRERTTIGYVAEVMRNLDGVAGEVAELLRDLPRDDHRRRAHLLRVLATYTSFEKAGEAGASVIHSLFRALLEDRDELPQIRLLALQYLQPVLGVDDAMAIKAMLPDEDEPMRRALSDFLFEFF